VIQQLKNSNSSGYDDISNNVLKSCVSVIPGLLAELFNTSFETGLFPDVYKLSKVIPLYKKGDKQCVDNYRAISLLPTISKVLEHLMYSRLTDFLQDHDLLHPQQYGFRRGKSTTSATFNFLQTVQQLRDQKYQVMAIFLDLSKAFDSINHDILLSKMLKYGVRGVAHSWFSSYLSNRQQFVSLSSGEKSNTLNVSCGVPQGSILGPLLFLLYINDLPHHINNCHVILYADDTTLVVADRTLDDTVNKCNQVLQQVSQWLKTNHLRVNTDKCCVVSFNKLNNTPPAIVIDNNSIQLSDSCKLLGVVVDSGLTWHPHSAQLTKKLNKALYSIRCLSSHVTQEVLLIVYNAYFHSLLRYGVIFWGNSPPAKNIFILQKKKAVRWINNPATAKFYPSCRSVFKCVNSVLPVYL
jgi:hypothetical protein